MRFKTLPIVLLLWLIFPPSVFALQGVDNYSPPSDSFATNILCVKRIDPSEALEIIKLSEKIDSNTRAIFFSEEKIKELSSKDKWLYICVLTASALELYQENANFLLLRRPKTEQEALNLLAGDIPMKWKIAESRYQWGPTMQLGSKCNKNHYYAWLYKFIVY